MYSLLMPRMVLSDGEVLKSQEVLTEKYSVLVLSVTVYQVTGAGPTLDVGLETSDDGEIWTPVGAAPVSSTVPGINFGVVNISTTQFG